MNLNRESLPYETWNDIFQVQCLTLFKSIQVTCLQVKSIFFLEFTSILVFNQVNFIPLAENGLSIPEKVPIVNFVRSGAYFSKGCIVLLQYDIHTFVTTAPLFACIQYMRIMIS